MLIIFIFVIVLNIQPYVLKLYLSLLKGFFCQIKVVEEVRMLMRWNHRHFIVEQTTNADVIISNLYFYYVNVIYDEIKIN